MSMGFCGCAVDIIEEQDILTFPTAGPVFQKLLDFINEHEVSKYDIEDLENNPELKQLYDNFTTAFSNDTGLTICIGYHDNESDGDCHDDIDGIYWELQDIWQLTPTAQKIKDKIHHRSFVVLA